MFAPLGVHAEYVTQPAEIRPGARARARSGRPAIVNVITDPRIDAQTVAFATYGAI